MKSRFSRAILKTLVYADIFDYPLTTAELFRFLISVKPKSDSVFLQSLRQLTAGKGLIETKGNYLFLKNRSQVVKIRQERKAWSQSKVKIALKVAGYLRLIPWIKVVAVTGTLAMENAVADDDIDFFIITGKRRLWLTRFLVVVLLEMMGRRRHPGDQKVKDKICLNMLLDEDHLSLPLGERDLFTAHEICQLKPLWEREGKYRSFMLANRWVKKYLPNCLGEFSRLRSERVEKKGSLCLLASRWLDLWEYLFYRWQLNYMRPRRTTEITETGRIRFHPQDCREWVLAKYQQRLGETIKQGSEVLRRD